MVRDWWKRRSNEGNVQLQPDSEAGYGGAGPGRPYAVLEGRPAVQAPQSQDASASGIPWQPRYPPVQYSPQNSFGAQYAASPQTPSPFARLSSTSSLLTNSLGPATSSQGPIDSAALEQFEFETALALSKTADEEARAAASSEDTAIARAKRLSLQPVCCGGKAEALSYKLWDSDSLEYDDLIVDGVYDIWGEFREFRSPEGQPTFPTLMELAALKPGPDDMREVVLVNHDKDPGLCEAEERAAEAINSLCEQGPIPCVQGLARVVAAQMGGACSLAELKQRYQAYFTVLRGERTSVVTPIGGLEVGLPRHRALLFKTLADACELPCKILRGLNLGVASGGWPGAAVVVVRINTDQELLVDLVQKPGQTFSVRPDSIPKVLPPEDVGPSCALDELPRDLVTRASSLGLEWQDETEEPALIPFGTAEGRGQSGGSMESATTASTPRDMSRVTSLDGGPAPAVGEAAAPIRAVRLAHNALPSPYANFDLQNNSSLTGFSSGPPSSAALFDAQRSQPGSTASSGGHPARPSDFAFESNAFSSTSTPQVSTPVASSFTAISQPRASAAPPYGRRASPFDAAPAVLSIIGSAGPAPPVPPLAAGLFQTRPDTVQLRPQGTSQPVQVPLNVGPQALPQYGSNHVASQQLSGAESMPPLRPSPRRDPIGDQLPVRAGIRSMSALEAAGIVKGPADPFATLSPFAPFVAGTPGHPLVQRSTSGQVPMRGGAPGPSATSSISPSSALLPPLQPARATSQDPPRSSSDASPELVPRVPSGTQSNAGLAGLPAQSDLRGAGPRPPSGGLLQPGPQATPALDAWACPQAGVSSLADVAVVPQADGSEQRLLASTEERKRRIVTERLKRQALVAEAEEWEIAAEEIEMGPRIGIGSFGEVYRGTWRHTDVAVKRFLDQDISPQLLEEFRAEIAIMKRLKHPNVVLFMGAITQPPHLSIVTQFVPRGSLFRLLHRTDMALEEKHRVRMAMDIARGMNYLHSCRPPVIHRDLKSPNLLVDKDFTVKVCDFGLARVRNSTWLSGKSQAGTPEWTAPEVLKGQSYNEKSDVYSFGVILWELFTKEEPWQDKTPMQVVGAVGYAGARLPLPETLPPVIRDLISRCFSTPEERPSFSEAMEILKPVLRDSSLTSTSRGPPYMAPRVTA